MPLHDDRFNIVIVDDASQENIAELCSEYPVRYLRNESNQGFAVTCNKGAAAGESEYIIFMNSDIYLEEGALDHLLDPMRSEPQIGVVGAKLLFSDDTWQKAGTVQHAGILFRPSQEPYHPFIGWSADHPKVNQFRDVQAVTGALLATRRKLFEYVGGFNVDYGKGTFEDIDYCITARLAGARVVYNPKAVAQHHVGGSGAQMPLGRNFQIFRARCSQHVIWDEWSVL